MAEAPTQTPLQTTPPILNVSSSDSPVSSRSGSEPGNEGQAIHPQDLSPQSRRRHQKRMHMRLRRAQAKGEEADLAIDKLRTGRRKQLGKSASGLGTPTGESSDQKTKSEKTADTALSGSHGIMVDGDLTGMASADELNEDELPPTKIQYRGIRSSLARHNVTAEKIAASGLDVFNHLKLGKILKCVSCFRINGNHIVDMNLDRHFISGYDSDLDSHYASIDVETLSLLLEVLKDFLIQVMSRVIVVEEEHQRLRGTTKVWRKNADTVGIISYLFFSFVGQL